VWRWLRRRKAKPVTDEPDYHLDRNHKTRQGDPTAMRCRICGRSRVYRSNGGGLLFCPVCDHITPRKGTTTP